MGTFHEPIEVLNPSNRRRKISLEALVDTGAAYSLIPGRLLRGIGVKPSRTGRFKLADGRIVHRGVGLVTARVRHEETPTWVVFGDAESDPLLGASTLEELGLGVDSIHRSLVKVTPLPLSACLRPAAPLSTGLLLHSLPR